MKVLRGAWARRRRLPLLWLLLSLMTGLVSCEQKPTQIMVRVRSDFEPQTFDQVTVEARYEQGASRSITLKDYPLPFSLPVGTVDGRLAEKVTLIVTAHSEATMRSLETRASARFSPHRALLLDLELRQSCLLVDGGCPRNQTCRGCEGCAPVERDSLPLLTPADVEPKGELLSCAESPPPSQNGGTGDMDAQVDASAPGRPDSSVDGSADDSTDAQVDGSPADDTALPACEATDTACVRSISLASDHGCVVTYGGRMYCWGDNSYGQLCRGIGGSGAGPFHLAIVPGDQDWVEVAVSDRQTCGIKGDGTLHCCGEHIPGLSILYSPEPVPLAARDYTDVEAGVGWGCALTRGGDVYCWAEVDDGELFPLMPMQRPFGTGTWEGFGDGSSQLVLFDDADNMWVRQAGENVLTERGVQAASIRGAECIVRMDGELRCGGRNEAGQAGQGSDAPDPTTMEAISPAGVRFTDVTTWALGSCAISEEGDVWCWGDNQHGAMGIDPAEQRHVWVPRLSAQAPAGDPYIDVIIGRDTVCGMRRGRTVDCWGGTAPQSFGVSPAPLIVPPDPS